MIKEYPKYLYKYQSIDDLTNLSQNRTLMNLFKQEAIFSSRKNFNDLFDLKMELVDPTLSEVKSLRNIVLNKDKKEVSKYTNNNGFTKEWNLFYKNFIDSLNKMIDDYRIYCLSENPTNSLMWGHYSTSHYGFCIEFNSKYIKTDKMIYQNDIATFNVFELIKSSFLKNKDNHLLIKKIDEAFRTKLADWSYENEYRLIASKELLKNEIRRTDKISIFKYEEDWINSIIFGCRMPINVRKYIMEKIPYAVNFKEIIELKSTLKVIDYK